MEAHNSICHRRACLDGLFKEGTAEQRPPGNMSHLCRDVG